MRSPFFIVVLACCAALRATAQSTPAPFSTTPKLTGYLQPRFEVHGDTAVFFLRRARFALEGNVTPWASYRAQVEMRTAGAAATPAASPLSLSATDLWVKATHGGWGARGLQRLERGRRAGHVPEDAVDGAGGVYRRAQSQNRRAYDRMVRAGGVRGGAAPRPARRTRRAVRPE